MNSTLDTSSLEENPLHYLLGSSYRVEILNKLDKESSNPRDLKEYLDIPRSSLHRTLQELESKGWISRKGSQIKLTSLGAYVIDLYNSIEAEMNVIKVGTKITPWIHLDIEHLPILRQCEVNLKQDQPDPIEVFYDWIGTNNDFKAYFSEVPAFFIQYLKMTSDSHLNLATLYLSQSRISHNEYENLERIFDGSLNWTKCDIEFSFLFNSQDILLIGTDQSGIIQVAVKSNNESALEFGERKFEEAETTE